MNLYLSIPSLVERTPPDSITTSSLSSSNSNLSRDDLGGAGSSIPSSLLAASPTSSGLNPLSSYTKPQSRTSSASSSSSPGPTAGSLEQSASSTGSRSNTKTSSVFKVPTSSQSFPFSTETSSSSTISGPMVAQASVYPSDVGNGYLRETIAPSLRTSDRPSPPVSSTVANFSSPSSTYSEPSIMSIGFNSSMPSPSSLMSSSHSLSSDSSSISTPKTFPLPPTPTMTSDVSSTSINSGLIPSSTISAIPSASTPLPLHPAMKSSTSLVFSTFTITSISSATYTSHVASTSNSPAVSIVTSTPIPSTSTFIVSTTDADGYSSSVAVTPWASTVILTPLLPHSDTTTWTTTTSGVLSTVGTDNTVDRLSNSPGLITGIALGILAAFAFAVLWLFCARRRQRQLIRDTNTIAPGGPLEAEIDMEEPYAGILAALSAGMGAGRDAHIEGDTSGEVSGELAIPPASSPTLPLYSLPGEGHNDGLYVFPLSPPPPTQVPAPPPSAYVLLASCNGPRRSSPGPDASAWFGGYNVAPAYSVTSHHSHSTSNILTRTETGTRTRTGSEEPLLTRTGSGSSSCLDSGNKIRLGSAFGSPQDRMSGRDLAPTSLSSGKRSNTVSSFGALGSISSQGALRSTSSHGYDFGFGTTSSGAGSHLGPALEPTISGNHTSRRDAKWKEGKRESTGSITSATSGSALGSADEKPGGVRAFFSRIRLRNTPSPKSDSSRDIESEGEKRDTDASGPYTPPRTFSAVLSPATPPPEPGHELTTPRFVLSNPDPQPHPSYVKVEGEGALHGHEGSLQPPAWPLGRRAHANLLPSSPAFTLESRISAPEGLLDPRLCETFEGRSNASLRDFEDYSRPIRGLVYNRINSTTTFGTVDSLDGSSIRNREDDQQDDVHTTAVLTRHAIYDVDGGEGEGKDDFYAY